MPVGQKVLPLASTGRFALFNPRSDTVMVFLTQTHPPSSSSSHDYVCIFLIWSESPNSVHHPKPSNAHRHYVHGVNEPRSIIS
jgi:hypothetical protein